MRRGEIWQVDLNPFKGGEMAKERPVVIVNVDSIRTLNLRVVVPVTGWQGHFENKPWLVKLSPSKTNGLRKVSAANCFQVRSIAEERFLERIGSVSSDDLQDIIAAISIVVGF